VDCVKRLVFPLRSGYNLPNGTDGIRPSVRPGTREAARMSVPSTTPVTYDSYLARKYIPELDGLRGLSVLLVISHHMHDRKLWHWAGGWLGVSVFFVLSGYLITMLALREEKQRGAVSLKAFYVRRSCRIFPLYYVTLALYCVLILGVGMMPEKRVPLVNALPYYLLYMQEVPAFFGVQDAQGIVQKENVPFSHSWSLGIEEKFYLVWPLLAFVLWRGLTGRRQVGALVLLLLFGLIPLPVFNLGDLATALHPYTRILVGCLLAVLIEERGWFERLRFLGNGLVAIGALSIFLFLHFLLPQIGEASMLTYLVDTVYNLSVGVFLASVLMGEGWLQRVLRWGPIVFIGKYSYGIYLLHVFALNIAEKIVEKIIPPDSGRVVVGVPSFVLACVLSVAAAYLAGLLIEKPCIEWGRRWSKRILDAEAKAKQQAVAPVAG
jgi:peptidoglycan/LPS O-acetylase OafA/YrhL